MVFDHSMKLDVAMTRKIEAQQQHKHNLGDNFRNFCAKLHKRIGYNLNVMRQYACLVIYPITVDNFAAHFNCTPVDRA